MKKTNEPLAAYLFSTDPELCEALAEWFEYETWENLKDRLEFLKARALATATTKESNE